MRRARFTRFGLVAAATAIAGLMVPSAPALNPTRTAGPPPVRVTAVYQGEVLPRPPRTRSRKVLGKYRAKQRRRIEGMRAAMLAEERIRRARHMDPSGTDAARFRRLVAGLTNWQRVRWAGAGYPGLRDRDPSGVRPYAEMRWEDRHAG